MKRIVRLSVVRPVLTWAAFAAVALVAGCSSLNSALQSDRVEYKSAETGPSLAVPPDLSSLAATPAAPIGGATSLSSYEKKEKVVAAQPKVQVLPEVPGMKVMRDGNERWLVVHQAPGDLWPTLRQFWQEQGFVLTLDSPDTGVMETGWEENRAKIPQDFIRNLLGKVIDGLYSTGVRDRFRTRVERGPDGTTDVFITHSRMVEVYTNSQKDTTKWEPAPSDPGLEAIFLTKLMQRLGATAEAAKSEVQAAAPAAPATRVINAADKTYLDINEPYDRAWVRVGVALDRANFTVTSSDRQKGLYQVRYVDPAALRKDNGFFYSLFHSKQIQASKEPRQYNVNVRGESNDQTRVYVLDPNGNIDTSDIAKNIIGVLSAQLQ
ncbi:MAG: outer membrane protein assembly factor BamC [Burkholderiales bacterium]|nr:outer membrane protein assembly factor BamC [Burkholderiales bacterium]MDE2289122.1 outer membrane protein assembly factor BamC [Burkholderiales bacterium]MDE2609085.1 outer membrane protein assembly factor BamC [Burkholderiales bacterium]